jgi:hypothetical protein
VALAPLDRLPRFQVMPVVVKLPLPVLTVHSGR